jgi:hypothetical protein
MAVNGRTVDALGDSIVISLVTPYLRVKSVTGYIDVVIGEDTLNYFDKEFRWSTDNVTYSDYQELNSTNLQNLLLNPSNPFWIQYRYTVAAIEFGHEMTFESISLEVLTEQGTLVMVPQYECCDGDANVCNNLVIECCPGRAWNPYNIGAGVRTYQTLSQVVSNIFGFCVQYYKTEADQRSRDVILKEYSLFNVMEEAEVKILVPDNALPTREIAFNPLGMDYALDTFEIHIVKTEFEKIFGRGTHPSEGDYLYFPIMRKMYQVNSIANPDDFMYSASYWRVGLTTYQQATNFKFGDVNIEESTMSLISDLDSKFGEEALADEIQSAKPNQYRRVGTGSNDYIRRVLNKRLVIKEEKLYNNWTIVAKNYYDLSTVATGLEALTYRYEYGIQATEDRTINFWFRPRFIKPVFPNMQITSLASSGVSNKVVVTTVQTPSLNVGDLIVLSGTVDYDGVSEVLEVTDGDFTISRDFITDGLRQNPKAFKEESCKFLVYDPGGDVVGAEDYFHITFSQDFFVIKINEEYFYYDLRGKAMLLKDRWYAGVVNLSNSFNQLSLFIWESQSQTGLSDPTRTAELGNVYTQTITLTSKIDIPDGHRWRILGCNTHLTNLRVFVKPIEIELQSLVLSQYVVDDNQLADIIDNASPQLRLATVTNPR